MITAEIKGVTLTLSTDPELFSPSGVDVGTLAMLEETDFPDGMILDLGCGCGIVGIVAAKLNGAENVVMCDINPRAVEISRENADLNGVGDVRIYQSEGLRDIPERGFSLILSNPPYHADFSVPKHFIEEGFRRLKVGGKMVMVTKRLDWYKNKLTAFFGGVKVAERDGYYIFTAEKRGERRKTSEKKKGGLSKKLARKKAR